MNKYYRVKEDNFLWKKGAILTNPPSSNGYYPIEDIWDNTPCNGTEYISKQIIEHEQNAKYFERVYLQSGVVRSIYRTADQLKKLYNNNMKSNSGE